MDSLLAASTESGSRNTAIFAGRSAKANANLHVINALAKESAGDRVNVAFRDLYQGLSVTAQRMIDKLNELLKAEVPNGIQSLKPEDFTPEKTAERIVRGVTGLFAVFAKRHPELSGEELVSGFMETIRAGVHRGYDEAFSILQDIGVFKLDGIQSGIEKTKILIDEKLAAFETYLRQQLGVETPAMESDLAAKQSTAALLNQGGVQTQQLLQRQSRVPLDQAA